MSTKKSSQLYRGRPRFLRSFQSLNIRVAIVIIVIAFCAYVVQNVISRTMYINVVGFTPTQSLENNIDFTSHPQFDLILETMPEDIAKILSEIQAKTSSNNSAAQTYFEYRYLILLVVLFAIIPILLSISVAINRRITAPIRSLISATRQLARGDFSTRAKPNKNYWDNYSLALADDFNSMSSSLERLEEERQSMIADIAHELRTPITTMQLRLEAVQDGVDPLNLSLIDSLYKETELLSGLIVDLRTLSLAEAKQLSLNQESFDLYQLMDNTIIRFAALAQKKNISLSIEGIEGTYIYADSERINQILNNLMSNAIRHTPIDGKVILAFDSLAEGVSLKVINTGSALAQKELDQIFNRFYRSGKGRVRAEGGSGLGLAIVKALAELHGGSVSVENHGEDGIMFQLFLPQNYS